MEPERRTAELEAELAAKDTRIAEQDARIAEQAAEITEQRAQMDALRRQVAELSEQLGRNSGNSNQPASSDSPKARANRRGKSGKGKRGRGGQPGHRGSRRTLLAAEHVDDVVDMFSEHCVRKGGTGAPSELRKTAKPESEALAPCAQQPAHAALRDRYQRFADLARPAELALEQE